MLVLDKTLQDWTIGRIQEWLRVEHDIEVSLTTIKEDRAYCIREAAQDADELRQTKIAQMLGVSAELLPLVHGRAKVLVRDPNSLGVDDRTGELLDNIGELVPTTAQRLEVLKVWLNLAREMRYWVGVDRIEPAARPDPMEMGLTDVDRELAEMVELLGHQPERRSADHPG